METLDIIIAVIYFISVGIAIYKVFSTLDKKLALFEQRMNLTEEKICDLEDMEPVCNKRFHDIHLDIQQIKKEEAVKDALMKEVVKDILTPVLKEMTQYMKEYTDVKTGIITRELENIKQENMIFKGDIKSLMIEFKDHTEKSIDRLVKVIEKSDGESKK